MGWSTSAPTATPASVCIKALESLWTPWPILPSKLKRRETHAVFDGYWKGRQIKRTAYQWLARQMGLPEYRIHIGQMDMEQCERVIQIIYAQLQKTKEAA